MKEAVQVESASAVLDARIRELKDWRGKTLAKRGKDGAPWVVVIQAKLKRRRTACLTHTVKSKVKGVGQECPTHTGKSKVKVIGRNSLTREVEVDVLT